VTSSLQTFAEIAGAVHINLSNDPALNDLVIK